MPDWRGDEAMGDEDPGDEWFERMEPEWHRLRAEAMARFPPGTEVRDRNGRTGRVLLVDSMGDLHVDSEPGGVGIVTSQYWDRLTVISRPDPQP